VNESSDPGTPRPPRPKETRPRRSIERPDRGPARPIGPVRRPGQGSTFANRPGPRPYFRDAPRPVEGAEPAKPPGRWFDKAERDRQLAPPKPPAPSEIAAGIIARADRDHPADRLLRDELRRVVALSPANAAWLSRAVFSYYRWRGWVKPRPNRPHATIVPDVLSAVALAERFVTKPTAFPDAEMVDRVGPEWASRELEITPELARAWQREPTLWLRCRPGRTEEVAAGLRDCAPGPLPDSLRYGGSLDLFSTSLFHEGAFEIQDIASQAVSVMAAPQPGETWWDACAGEGGKTLHLGALMQGKGLVWASDRAEWRLQRLRVRAARAGCFNQRTILWKDSQRPPTRTKFDGVLVDAPCVGLGTWGRNPHARWTTSPQDVTELAAIQSQLLRSAASALKPGGKLIYAVCTLTRSETVAVADALETATSGLRPYPLRNPFAPATDAAARWYLWPQDTGGNGMFIAGWQKSAVPIKPAGKGQPV